MLQATAAGFEAVRKASTELESRLLMAHAEETFACLVIYGQAYAVVVNKVVTKAANRQ